MCFQYKILLLTQYICVKVCCNFGNFKTKVSKRFKIIPCYKVHIFLLWNRTLNQFEIHGIILPPKSEIILFILVYDSFYLCTCICRSNKAVHCLWVFYDDDNDNDSNDSNDKAEINKLAARYQALQVTLVKPSLHFFVWCSNLCIGRKYVPLLPF